MSARRRLAMMKASCTTSSTVCAGTPSRATMRQSPSTWSRNHSLGRGPGAEDSLTSARAGSPAGTGKQRVSMPNSPLCEGERRSLPVRSEKQARSAAGPKTEGRGLEALQIRQKEEMGVPKRNDGRKRSAERDSLPQHQLRAQLHAAAQPRRGVLGRVLHPETIPAGTPGIELDARPQPERAAARKAPGAGHCMRGPVLETDPTARAELGLRRAAR